MNRYLFANTLVILICWICILWPVWSLLSWHWTAKAVVSMVGFLVAAFFVERIACKWVNGLIDAVWAPPEV